MTKTEVELITKEDVAAGVVHKMPADLAKALTSDDEALAKWRGITPLARNEWICWTVNVKQEKTRDGHVQRVVSELKEGMRRPCCWIGCIHRPGKAISPSVRGVPDKRSEKERASNGR
jgi:hypothetical protein